MNGEKFTNFRERERSKNLREILEGLSLPAEFVDLEQSENFEKNGLRSFRIDITDLEAWGKYGDRGTTAEQNHVASLSRAITQEYIDCDVTVPAEQLPANFIVVREDIGPVPPMRESDIKFGKGDEDLEETFRKSMLETQKNFYPHTAYGILLNVREKK